MVLTPHRDLFWGFPSSSIRQGNASLCSLPLDLFTCEEDLWGAQILRVGLGGEQLLPLLLKVAVSSVLVSPLAKSLIFRPLLPFFNLSFPPPFIIVSQCPGLLATTAIYTSTSKQTLTQDGPLQPPTSSQKKTQAEKKSGRGRRSEKEWETWEETSCLITLT